MADASHILQEALALQAGDRARIARQLIESLEVEDRGVAALWREEVRRRIDEIDSGTADLEDWASVRDGLRSAVGR